MDNFKIGDKVRLMEDIYEHADDYAPGGYLARKGEVLIVRRVHADSKTFPYSISHEYITDNSFAVFAHEIEAESIQPERGA